MKSVVIAVLAIFVSTIAAGPLDVASPAATAPPTPTPTAAPVVPAVAPVPAAAAPVTPVPTSIPTPPAAETHSDKIAETPVVKPVDAAAKPVDAVAKPTEEKKPEATEEKKAEVTTDKKPEEKKPEEKKPEEKKPEEKKPDAPSDKPAANDDGMADVFMKLITGFLSSFLGQAAEDTDASKKPANATEKASNQTLSDEPIIIRVWHFTTNPLGFFGDDKTNADPKPNVHEISAVDGATPAKIEEIKPVVAAASPSSATPSSTAPANAAPATATPSVVPAPATPIATPASPAPEKSAALPILTVH